MNSASRSDTALIPLTPDINDREFVLLSRLIHERSGIKLGDQKRALLRARLGKRLRTLGLRTFQEYYTYLTERDTTGGEMIQMLDAISTNLTEFFRGPSHFDYLKQSLLPRWQKEPTLRILSAGCSTGEEPYSLAMVAYEFFGSQAPQKIQISAGDISTRVLARAKAGIYQMERIKNLSPERLRTYFLRGTGNSEGLVRVTPELQSLVTFYHMNLTEPMTTTSAFHAVFCRNVAIYFDQPTQNRVFGNLFDLLVPGGTLFLGHSESMICCTHPYHYVQPTVYEKRRP